MPIAAISTLIRPILEGRLPDGVEVEWVSDMDQARSAIHSAEIGWLDSHDKAAMHDLILAGERLKWVSTIYAGLDHFPVEALRERGTIVTNGVGINTIAVAEYALMGMLNLAKAYPQVLRSADQRQWLADSPGKIELYQSRALIIGYGAIGSAIGGRLKAFGVEVTGVARRARPDQNILGKEDWQSKLSEFDWVILATPATAETAQLLGKEQLAAIKPEAFVINMARGDCIDQDALIDVLQQRKIAGAFLDVTSPEPLPADHPLWALDNVQLSMHLSGRAQSKMFQRSAALFLTNLQRYLKGEALENRVDLALGY